MGKDENTNSGAYKWLVLGNIMIGTFMAVLDSTVVNTGLPAIMGTLGASINTAEWVLTGYMLAIASILPAAAWLSDRFGYKRIYFLSLLVFTFGSFMCGNSTSIEELIFWRVIEGLGCGAIMPVGMAIVSNVFPPEQRGTALGFWAIASAASVSFGPSIGGYLVDNLNWNYIFYVNVPVGIIALFVTVVLQKEYKAETVQPFDIPGFITSGIFLPLFMYGLSEVNSSTNTQGWNSPIVLGSMWISAIMFILFIYIELTVKYPLINLRIFKDRNFTLANVMMFIFGVGMFGSTFLIPLYLQNNLGYSALQAGMFFIPVGIIQGFCSPTAGTLGQKINPKILIAGGLILMALSFYLNIFLSFLTEKWYIMMSLYLRGIGMGILFTPLLTLSLANIRIDMMAQASSLTNIIRQMGGSFGVAIFSHVLTQRTSYHTQRYSEALNYTGEIYHQTIDKLSAFALQTTGATEGTAKSLAEQLILERLDLEAYIGGINDDFYIAFIVTLLCLIPVFWLRKVKKGKTTKQ
ncbi:DHA2 family efflux MFS transporter permease subunit [Parabacteroides faecis]|uniref:DHA2 family efflux MFS transporter permease subunit n=1 Tax=Parabacteroides faecis TaxID=1217282 RepID=UPI003521937F